MPEPVVDHAAFAAAVAKIQADHQAILGKPTEGPLEIAWEAVQRASATDAAVAAENSAADGITTLLQVVLPELLPADAPFVPAEARVINYLLHRMIAGWTSKVRADEARRRADAVKLAGGP